MILNVDPLLSQWDVDRIVKVSDTDATHIHFANPGDSKAAIMEIAAGEAKIPNYLLQTGKPIIAYAVLNEVTLEHKTFPVSKRERPEDYVYEDDQRNYIYELIRSAEDAVAAAESVAEALKAARDNGEFNGAPGEDYVLTDKDRQEIASFTTCEQIGAATREEMDAVQGHLLEIQEQIEQITPDISDEPGQDGKDGFSIYQYNGEFAMDTIMPAAESGFIPDLPDKPAPPIDFVSDITIPDGRELQVGDFLLDTVGVLVVVTYVDSEIFLYSYVMTIKGRDGADGYTPQKGVDYCTEEEKAELAEEIANSVTPEKIGAVTQEKHDTDIGELRGWAEDEIALQVESLEHQISAAKEDVEALVAESKAIIVTVASNISSLTTQEIYDAVVAGKVVYLKMWSSTYTLCCSCTPDESKFESSYSTSVIGADGKSYACQTFRMFVIANSNKVSTVTNTTASVDYINAQIAHALSNQ